MRIGGFVIHGNNAGTLGPCLDSLLSVCDEVVAVDSCSTDGSAALVEERGIRRVVVPWQGYGAARAAAAAALPGCDWIFFLDSDERLSEGSVQAFLDWRRSEPAFPHYRLRCNDWAELPSRRFLFRSETHVRLLRREAATWLPGMVVHEALPKRAEGRMGAVIEHLFATSLDELVQKQDRYALLWALRAHLEGRRGKSPLLQRPVHLLRDGLIKGAFLRGGSSAFHLAWGVSRYHARKYEFLREVRAGGHQRLVELLRGGRIRDLFLALPQSAS